MMPGDQNAEITARTTSFFRLKAVRRLLRQDDGAAAVEFAMVAAPFLAIIFAIIETCIVFFASQTLEAAAADASRLVMTGQAQNGGFDAQKFKDAACAKIVALFDCSKGIMVDVRKFSEFSAVDTAKPVDANGNVNFTPQYNPGGPGDIVLVRLIYQYPVWVNLAGYNLANAAGGKYLMVATAAFRNEPYK
jgi:Flp pilus assembly protein TadG